MSADLHIHVLTCDARDLVAFFSHTLGSRYFDLSMSYDPEVSTRVGDTPNVHVGEVSWLKAALFDDAATYVPDPIAEVHRVIGEHLPVIDDELIAAITNALTLNNETLYKLSDAKDVVAFLEKHRGQRCFTMSW